MDQPCKDEDFNSGYQLLDNTTNDDAGSGDENTGKTGAGGVGTANFSPKGWYQGHSFVKKNFHKPATCHHCSDMLWGILGTTGMVCEICNFLAHEKCIRHVVSPCTCIVPFLVQDPVPHCWSDIGHFKRKFCNVCRKRLDDLLAVRCEICEYYAHYECLDFVSADCKQCAVSNPKSDVKVPRATFGNVSPGLLDSSAPLTESLLPGNQYSSPGVCGGGGDCSPASSLLPQSPSPIQSSMCGGGGMAAAVSNASSGAAPGAPSMTPVTASCSLAEAVASGRRAALVAQRLAVGDAPSPPPQAPPPDSQAHHWREGNLPLQSKCAACRKTCWSAECLSCMRCEWCGVTAHYACYKSLPIQCDFGVLRDIMLPPCAVSLPRTSVLMEHIIGMMKPQPEQVVGVQALTDEFSSSGDSPEESGFERKSMRDKSDRDFDDYVRVYDGFARYRKRQCRYLSLGKSVSVRKVIELSLKAFQLPPDEVKDFCLLEINEKDCSDRILDINTSFKSQLMFETRRPQIILQYKEKYADRDFINVYPGILAQYRDISTTSIQVAISKESTACDALVATLKKLNLEDMDATKYHLVETVLDKGLTERVLPSEERPWDLIDRVKKESVRALRLTRFYVRPVEDPHGPGVALFVGNLKKGLSQRLYEKILLEKLGQENKWDSIDVIYYDFGSLVILYSNAEKADEAYNILKSSHFEDRPILAMILPRVQPQAIPPSVQPLLVFVNVKSGGCQGIELITSFRKLLNPHQVFNLDYGGPLPGLHCFRHLGRFKILVCGGDGTVGWALSCLDNVGQDAACPTPPMAILPLGTGNDLARVLRWGPGYTGAEEPMTLLRDVVEAEEIRLDRWTVVIKPDQVEKDAQKKQLQLEANAANTNEDTSRIFVMNNYFGIGIDADLNLDFHMAREENPAKFNSRIHNKSVYFKMGLRKMVNRTKCKDLHQNIVVEVDGRQIDLPPLEGIIILNILSWGAGANPWGVEKDDAFKRPTHYDGHLEVVGVTGVVHMGQIFSGLRTGSRLAQGGHIRITLKTDIPVQVDGEPWVQSPGQIIVLRSALKATMLKKRKRRKVNRRHTEPGLGAAASHAAHQPAATVLPPPPQQQQHQHNVHHHTVITGQHISSGAAGMRSGVTGGMPHAGTIGAGPATIYTPTSFGYPTGGISAPYEGHNAPLHVVSSGSTKTLSSRQAATGPLSPSGLMSPSTGATSNTTATTIHKVKAYRSQRGGAVMASGSGVATVTSSAPLPLSDSDDDAGEEFPASSRRRVMRFSDEEEEDEEEDDEEEEESEEEVDAAAYDPATDLANLQLLPGHAPPSHHPSSSASDAPAATVPATCEDEASSAGGVRPLIGCNTVLVTSPVVLLSDQTTPASPISPSPSMFTSSMQSSANTASSPSSSGHEMLRTTQASSRRSAAYRCVTAPVPASKTPPSSSTKQQTPSQRPSRDFV